MNTMKNNGTTLTIKVIHRFENKSIINAFLIIITAIFPLILFSQIKMEAYFGESGRTDYSTDIDELYDKGLYITGGYEGEKGWNNKIDINLEPLYETTLEYPGYSMGFFSSVSDQNGNIYLAGYIFYSSQWPLVIKLDSCGDKVWCKILDYSDEFEYGSAADIIINLNGDVVVLVNLESETQIDMVHLVGLTSDGDVLWTKPYASNNNYPWISTPIAYKISIIKNEYYISGKCYWPFPSDTTHVYLRPLFIGIDSLFNEKWILPFAALDSVFGKAYKTIAINDSILMGVGMRRLDDPEESGLLMFFTTNGKEKGYKEITKDQIGPDVSQIYFTDISKINNELFIASSPIGYNDEVFPAAEIIIDTAANIFNFQDRPGTIGNMNMTKTYDGKFVFTASYPEGKSDNDIYVYKIDENLNDVPFDSTYHNYDSLCPGGIQSGTIDLSDCFVWTNIGDAPTPQEYYAGLEQIPVKAYPNPVTGTEITFEYENTGHHRNIQLSCFNIYGEEVHKEKIYRNQGASIVNVSGWQKGMYFAVVYSNGKVVGKCKFVVR